MSKPSHLVDAHSQQKNMTGIQVISNDMELLSLPKVAKMLQVSHVTLYRLMAHGSLSGYRVGRRMRFHKDQVLEYLNRNQYGRKED